MALPGLLRIQAMNGMRYQLVDVQTGVAPVHVLMRRRGKSLIIDFMDDAGRDDSVELAGFFDAELIDFGVVGAGPGAGMVAYDAHPSHGIEDPLRLLDGQTALWSVGERQVASAVVGSANSEGISWVPVLMSVAAVGVAVGGGSGVRAPSASVGESAERVVQGLVAAGPVLDGHGLVVRVFANDGVELGSGTVEADGRYSVRIGSGYTGAVWSRCTT